VFLHYWTGAHGFVTTPFCWGSDWAIALSVCLLQLQVLLEADPFLNELTKLYERNKTSGSVWVTMKRSTLKHQKKRKTIEESPAVEPEYRCLVRATDGKKTISCTLSAKDHQRFQTSYATVLKAHMDALKKREKKDKKSASTKAPGS
jgi:signal recognition particle subunit SRP14